VLRVIILPCLDTPDEMIDYAEKQGTVKNIVLWRGPDGMLRGGAAVEPENPRVRRIVEIE
jgi:hypothetical protein